MLRSGHCCIVYTSDVISGRVKSTSSPVHAAMMSHSKNKNTAYGLRSGSEICICMYLRLVYMYLYNECVRVVLVVF